MTRPARTRTGPRLQALLALCLLVPLSAYADGRSLQTRPVDGVPHVALDSLAAVLDAGTLAHTAKAKLELMLPGHRIVFTLLSPYVVVDGITRRMPLPVRLVDGRALAAAEPLLALLAPSLPALKELPLHDAPQAPDSLRVPSRAFRAAAVDPKQWAIDVVVIDPGHGGRDPGAVGPSGTQEKDIVLKVAGRLQDLLERKLKVRAVLTRADDRFVPLGQRARIAIREGGKIFVSLHCNASRRPQSAGTEVFFLSEAKTAEAAEVARMENAALRFEEAKDPEEGHAELEGIARGLLSTQFLKESQDLAADVRRQIAQHVDTSADRGVKQANFYVMRGTMGAMPSVLVELGFITNRAEERRLRSTLHQKRLAEAIYRGIQAFKLRYEGKLANGR